MPGGANRGSAGKVLQDCYTLQQATIDLRRLLRRALPGERAGPRPATLHQLLALHRVVRQALERLDRSEEHTSDSSHGYISYAVFCLKKKKKNKAQHFV